MLDMPKSKRKSKKQQDREKRDSAETAFAVFQQATSGKGSLAVRNQQPELK
jgi:hypothetical protein